MMRIYFSNFFRDFMRKISGHFHEGRYFFSKIQIKPSEELKSKIFPWIDKIIDDMMHNRYEVNLSGKDFLLFMKYFKTVFFIRFSDFTRALVKSSQFLTSFILKRRVCRVCTLGSKGVRQS
jgi:hypothetical protein